MPKLSLNQDLDFRVSNGLTERKELLLSNHYFDNELVEHLMHQYMKTACTDIKFRDEIMKYASKLIIETIKAHNLGHIAPGKDETSAMDLFQTAWVQIESALYKYEAQPHCRNCYNRLRPQDSQLSDTYMFEDKLMKEIKNCPRCDYKISPEMIYYRGKSRIFNLWCVNPNSMITTNQGLRTISKVKVGDNVYGSGRLNNIIGTISKPKQKTLLIITQDGYELEGSKEHYVMSLIDGKEDWKQFKDLKIGNLVGLQYCQHLFGNNDDLSDIALTEPGFWEKPKFITPELAYIIGLYLAEGCHSDGMATIYNADKEVINILRNNSLNLKFQYYDEIVANYCCNRRFSEFLSKLGLSSGAQRKHIPDRILSMSKENINCLLSGLFDGDGHSTRHNGHVGFTSTSRTLIDQIRMLLLNIGIITKIHKDKRKTRRMKNRYGKEYVSKLSGSWQIMLPTIESYKFYDMIGFKINRKQNKMSSLKVPKQFLYGFGVYFNKLYKKYGSCGHFNDIRKIIRPNCFIEIGKVLTSKNIWSKYNTDPDYIELSNRIDEFLTMQNRKIWLPIKKIEQSECEVCDIEVDSEEHMYTANGFISHNSQIARTVGLAYIKKENRDRKNSDIFRSHLENRAIIPDGALARFMKEAKEICKYNNDHLRIIACLEELYRYDDRAHEGLISKLVQRTKLSRATITTFFKIIRFRSHELTDSPVNEENNRIKHNIDAKDDEYQ